MTRASPPKALLQESPDLYQKRLFVSDNGPELACAAMREWAAEHVGLHFIPRGEPWCNGHVESFNSRVRDECLNINSFWLLAQARVVISDWKHDYNHHRRSALGYQPPARYAATCIHR